MLKYKKRGFTLIEVLIVAAVLAGLILVVIPKVKRAREISSIKEDISTAGAEISSDSWNKASDIRVLSRDGSEKTLAECANVNDKAKAKQVKGCDFYVKLDADGNALVSVKEASKKKDEKGELIDTFIQIYPEVYADEPYKSNY